MLSHRTPCAKRGAAAVAGVRHQRSGSVAARIIYGCCAHHLADSADAREAPHAHGECNPALIFADVTFVRACRQWTALAHGIAWRWLRRRRGRRRTTRIPEAHEAFNRVRLCALRPIGF